MGSLRQGNSNSIQSVNIPIPIWYTWLTYNSFSQIQVFIINQNFRSHRVKGRCSGTRNAMLPFFNEKLSLPIFLLVTETLSFLLSLLQSCDFFTCAVQSFIFFSSTHNTYYPLIILLFIPLDMLLLYSKNALFIPDHQKYVTGVHKVNSADVCFVYLRTSFCILLSRNCFPGPTRTHIHLEKQS